MKIRTLTLLPLLAACAQSPSDGTTTAPTAGTPLEVEVAPLPTRPNIVFLMADDLGWGELGSYGQDKIRTPNLDRLAAQGMRFTQHYSGAAVCASSRAALLTGLHTGHAYIRDNDEMGERGDVWNDPALEGQRPLADSEVTLAEVLQTEGYTTAAIGKWGLGWTGSEGDPNAQGFDHFYGYACQRVAHNYYPTHLWRDGVKEELNNTAFRAHQSFSAGADPYDIESYDRYSGEQYAPDLMGADTLDWVRDNHDGAPFFLYRSFLIPHLALQVPDDSLVQYAGVFEDEPYLGGNGYLPHRYPRAAYAGMISRMDQQVGDLMDLLDELGIADNTIIVFSSDNGPSWVGGVDRDYFESTGGLRGRKAQLFEGGIRVPAIVRWNGVVAPGTVSDHISAFWDWYPTFREVAGANTLATTDGLSMLPTLSRRGDQAEHDYLYWEQAGKQQALRVADWKAYRAKPWAPLEVYDLASDPLEERDVARFHPELVQQFEEILRIARTENVHFPLATKPVDQASTKSSPVSQPAPVKTAPPTKTNG